MTGRRPLVWIGAVVVVLVLAIGAAVARDDSSDPSGPSATNGPDATGGPGSSGTPAPTAPPGQAGTRPNVLVIMVDDETYNELPYMPNVKSLLQAQGTTYSHYYTTTPNCCPSRAGYYTGQYPHNNGIKDNEPPLGGAELFIPHQSETLPVWLHDDGYYTASIGKYLNGWGNPDKPDLWTGGIAPPPGWDHWFGLVDPSTYQYYDYSVSDDGVLHKYGSAPTDYQTDVLGQEVVNTIQKGSASGKPWFVSWTPLAPHVGKREGDSGTNGEGGIDGLLPIAPPGKEDAFANEPLYSVPSQTWGPLAAATPDVSTKPPYVQDRVKHFPAPIDYMTQAWRAELATIQGVDAWIPKIVQALTEQGQLDRTTIMFTSDNGLFHGEHGLYQKGLLYEEAVHVPLVIRGAGFPAGKTADQLALNIDLTATIMSLAGATSKQPLDGRSLEPLAEDPDVAKDRAVMFETWYTGTHIATQELRVGPWALMRWSTGDIELYNLTNDPFEMHNLAKDPSYFSTVAGLAPRLDLLSRCAGASCEDSDASRAAAH
jgi:arylsulfatase A-like enzyme